MGIRKRLKDLNEDIRLLDGFDAAIIGVAERAGGMLVAAYDRSMIIDILARDMTREEAEEFLEFNILSAWVGEHTPVIVDFRAAE